MCHAILAWVLQNIASFHAYLLRCLPQIHGDKRNTLFDAIFNFKLLSVGFKSNDFDVYLVPFTVVFLCYNATILVLWQRVLVVLILELVPISENVCLWHCVISENIYPIISIQLQSGFLQGTCASIQHSKPQQNIFSIDCTVVTLQLIRNYNQLLRLAYKRRHLKKPI